MSGDHGDCCCGHCLEQNRISLELRASQETNMATVADGDVRPTADVVVTADPNHDYLRLWLTPKNEGPMMFRISRGAADVLFGELERLTEQPDETMVERALDQIDAAEQAMLAERKEQYGSKRR